MLPAPSQRWSRFPTTCPPPACGHDGQWFQRSVSRTATANHPTVASAANSCGRQPVSTPPARLVHPQQPSARSRIAAAHSPATTAQQAGSSAYEGNAAGLVAALQAWRARAGKKYRGNGAGSAIDDSDGAAVGGLIAALELGYQEASQGAWMARGFVAAFLEAGGAAELLAALRDPRRDVALQAFELVQTLIEQHPAARGALLAAGAVKELVRVLGSTSASPRVRFDCVMLLSDLLESAITARARAGERFPPTPRHDERGRGATRPEALAEDAVTAVAHEMAQDGGLRHVVRRLRSSNPSARAMAARLVGLVASCSDDLRAELLAQGALADLVTALGAMDTVASAGGPLPGGASKGAGLVPAFTVHHELGMQHQIAFGLLHLCSVTGAAAPQPELSPDDPEPPSMHRVTDGEPAACKALPRQLIDQLVEGGAVPPLLRLHGLGYPRPLREGARRALAPMVALRGEAVRAIAATVAVPHPRDTEPAAWQAWRSELDADLGCGLGSKA